MAKRKPIKLLQIEKVALLKEAYRNDPVLGVALQTGKLEKFISEIKAYECKEADMYNMEQACTYHIPANEVREIVVQLIQEGLLYVEGNPEDFIKKEPMTLFWYDESDWKDEWALAALKKNPMVYDMLSSVHKEKFLVDFLIMHPNRVENTLHTDSDLEKAIRINPDVFVHIPEEQVTRELLYQFLQTCITNSYMPSCYYWDNIPEEYKDKVYYQGRAMLHPFYLHDMPKEYFSKSLLDYIVEHIAEKGYTSPLNMLQHIPKEMLTEDIAVKLCSMHYMGVTYIPEEFKNNDFYEKLMKTGQYDFLCAVDLSTISTDLILQCMKHITKMQFYFGQEKIPKTIWTKEIVHEYARISNNYYAHVPKKLWTREDCLLNLRCQRTIDGLPKEYFDEEAVDAIMQNCYGIIHKIPDEYKTEEFYKKYMGNHLLYYKDIPEQYVTAEVIDSYITAGKNVPFEKIPMHLITKELIRKLFRYCPHYHFSQVHQNKEITTWIYEVIVEEKGKSEVQKYIYMLPCLTKEVIEDMSETIPVPRIAKLVLKSYLTQEMCDVFYEADPESIICFPEKIREKYRKSGGDVQIPIGSEKGISDVNTLDLRQETKRKQQEESKGDITETFVQLSLFDFLN